MSKYNLKLPHIFQLQVKYYTEKKSKLYYTVLSPPSIFFFFVLSLSDFSFSSFSSTISDFSFFSSKSTSKTQSFNLFSPFFLLKYISHYRTLTFPFIDLHSSHNYTYLPFLFGKKLSSFAILVFY